MDTASEPVDFVTAERERIQAEYRRRALEVGPDLYASWQPAEVLRRRSLLAVALQMLREANKSPRPDQECLEVGCGNGGWLSELAQCGVREARLHGIDVDHQRVSNARTLLSQADLRVGDASRLPWDTGQFDLVIASTLFTSILDFKVRRLIAGEVVRVLAPEGALLWYDFAYNNPRNPNVRGIRRAEIRNLFPTLSGRIRSVTLAPPLARLIAPRSWTLATLLEAIPLLRTHLLGVLVKGF